MLIIKPRQIKSYTLLIPLAFLGILPAMAELGDNIPTDFESYATELRDYVITDIPKTLKPVEQEAQEAINNSTGDINIPSPNEAGKQVRENILLNFKSDKFDNNSAVWAQIVSNELERQITRGAVEGVLGVEGQTRLKTTLDNIETTVDKVQKITKQAQGRGPESTKDAIVDLIEIQNEQSKITGETLASTMQMRQDLQYTNLNLANISQQMDEVNRARRVDTSAEAARLLRATAQTDLLGREKQQ